MHENMTRRLFRVMFRVMSYAPPRLPVPTQGAVLANVTLVRPGRERQPGQTVVVAGGLIASISPATEQQAVGPYASCFVLPGLIDMHVHIPPPARELCNILFLAHGVTTVRETGDADGTTWASRLSNAEGKTPGPHIVTCGPVLDGDPPFLPTSFAVANATAASAAVAALAERGADFIKVQHKLSPPALTAIVAAANERGLYVAGHIPSAVPYAQAHIHDVQHLDGLIPYPAAGETPLDYQRRWLSLTDKEIDNYVSVSVQQGLVHTPTLAASEALLRMADVCASDDPVLRLMPRYYRDGVWKRDNNPLFGRFTDDVLVMLHLALRREQDVVFRLQRAGVRLHLGDDSAAMPLTVPGATLHRDMTLIAEAGLSLAEVWIAGTSAAAATLRVPLLAILQPGAPADLLLFDQDPTSSLAALSSLRAVVCNGRLYSKEFLADALARHRQSFEEQRYERITMTLTKVGGMVMKPKA